MQSVLPTKPPERPVETVHFRGPCSTALLEFQKDAGNFCSQPPMKCDGPVMKQEGKQTQPDSEL